MHRERRLDVSERRDDDAPDAFDGVERQDAAMALHQAAHHVGLARRTESRAHLLGVLHLDQPVDDVAALHQQAVHLRIDRIDLLAQIGKRRRRRGRLGHFRKPDENIAPHPEERESASRRMQACSPSWFETAQGRLLTMRTPWPINYGLALTVRGRTTNFMSFRGHLSRPACSHVKQLAKQAGDRFDPGRTFVQAGFFMA